jgi:uncharacterized lipoprotein YmbA
VKSCRYLAWACALGLGAGCTSTSVSYYTLTPPAVEPAMARGAPIAVDVRVLHIPASLNRSELTVRRGPTGLVILENERWASPLRDEIKDAVRGEIERRLGSAGENLQSVSRLRLDIDVQRFEAALGQNAKVDAAWRLTLQPAAQEHTEPRSIACDFHDVQKIGPGYGDMVQGFQASMAALADAVGAALVTPQPGGADPCQPLPAHSNSTPRG